MDSAVLKGSISMETILDPVLFILFMISILGAAYLLKIILRAMFPSVEILIEKLDKLPEDEVNQNSNNKKQPKRSRNMSYYNVCRRCGASLDPAEKCICRQEKSPLSAATDKEQKEINAKYLKLIIANLRTESKGEI